MTDRRPRGDRRPQLDPEPQLRSWLRQPVDLPESDLARVAWLVHHTPQQRRWPLPHLRRSAPMFTALKLTAAGAILASLGIVLWSVAPTQNPVLPPAISPSPSAQPAPILQPSASPVASVSPGPSTPPLALGPVVLALEPVDAVRVGDWVKVGAKPRSNADGTGWGDLADPRSTGDLLVVRTTLSHPDETIDHRVLVSPDGLDWYGADVPGKAPVFNDLTVGPDGLLLAGSVGSGKKRTPALWTSSDGVTWTALAAPEGRTKVDRVVQYDPALTVIITGNQLWASRDGGAWENLGQTIEVLAPQAGPGGFVSCCDIGDGQTFMLTWNDPAWTTGRELGGPPEEDGRSMGPATDLRLAPMGDQWVFVPGRDAYPDVLFTSPDAIEDWTQIPRPAGLVGEELRWMTMVDGNAMAYGLSLEDGGVGAVWTWTLGDEAPAPALLPRTDEDLAMPTAWGDTYATTASWRSETSELSFWVHQPEG